MAILIFQTGTLPKFQKGGKISSAADKNAFMLTMILEIEFIYEKEQDSFSIVVYLF